MIAQPPIIQGWCYGALRPMESGDGWSLRMRPHASRLTHAQARVHVAAWRRGSAPHTPLMPDLDAGGLMTQTTHRAQGKAGRYAIRQTAHAGEQSLRQARGDVARRRGGGDPHAPLMSDLDAGGLLAQNTPHARDRAGRYATHPTAQAGGQSLRQALARDEVARRCGGGAPHAPLLSDSDAGGLLSKNTPSAQGKVDQYAIHQTAQAGGQSLRHAQAGGEMARRCAGGAPHVPLLSDSDAGGLLSKNTPSAQGKVDRYAIHPTAQAGGHRP